MLPDFPTNVNKTLPLSITAPGTFLLTAIRPAHFLFEEILAPDCGCMAGRGDEDDFLCVECESAMMAEPAELEPYPEELRRLEDAELVRFKEAA